MKKTISVLLALITIFGLAATAFADSLPAAYSAVKAKNALRYLPNAELWCSISVLPTERQALR